MHAQPTFSHNCADEDTLLAHLEAADFSFVPSLSSRVNLPLYAAKLHSHADRFEAWDGKTLVGLVAAYANDGSPFVSSVSVLAPWQGRGVARKLMQNFLLYVRQSRFTSVMLEASLHANSAIALYESLGFVIKERNNDNGFVRMALSFSDWPSPS
jgi:ribosomal protein S18 acetylase RimI-like enzyme